MKTLILAAIRCSLVFGAVAALSVTEPAKANLITNGDFETGDFSGWSVSGPASVEGTVGSIAPHSGNFQAQLGFFAAIGQTLATTPGQSYSIDLWAATPDVLNISIALNGLNLLGFVSGPTDYTEFNFLFTASSTSTSIVISQQSFGTALLDDITVNQFVPDGGSTVSLLGCALLGMAALRRKLGC